MACSEDLVAPARELGQAQRKIASAPPGARRARRPRDRAAAPAAGPRRRRRRPGATGRRRRAAPRASRRAIRPAAPTPALQRPQHRDRVVAQAFGGGVVQRHGRQAGDPRDPGAADAGFERAAMACRSWRPQRVPLFNQSSSASLPASCRALCSKAMKPAAARRSTVASRSRRRPARRCAPAARGPDAPAAGREATSAHRPTAGRQVEQHLGRGRLRLVLEAGAGTEGRQGPRCGPVEQRAFGRIEDEGEARRGGLREQRSDQRVGATRLDRDKGRGSKPEQRIGPWRWRQCGPTDGDGGEGRAPGVRRAAERVRARPTPRPGRPAASSPSPGASSCTVATRRPIAWSNPRPSRRDHSTPQRWPSRSLRAISRSIGGESVGAPPVESVAGPRLSAKVRAVSTRGIQPPPAARVRRRGSMSWTNGTRTTASRRSRRAGRAKARIAAAVARHADAMSVPASIASRSPAAAGRRSSAAISSANRSSVLPRGRSFIAGIDRDHSAAPACATPPSATSQVALCQNGPTRGRHP